MLREFGCPEAQGFLYGQPGAPEATGTANVTPIKRGTSASDHWLWATGRRALALAPAGGFRALPKKDMML